MIKIMASSDYNRMVLKMDTISDALVKNSDMMVSANREISELNKKVKDLEEELAYEINEKRNLMTVDRMLLGDNKVLLVREDYAEKAREMFFDCRSGEYV